MAPSEALRTRSKSTDKQSILAERAALTRQTLGSAYISHLHYHHLHAQRSQTLTFGDGWQVLTGSWTSTEQL